MRQSNTVGVQAVARGPARWYVLDGLGSVVAEVDPQGNVTASEKYDAYGSLRGGSGGGTATTHHFVGGLGHMAEAGTGLIYMRARYYDPVVGSFQSQDPALQGWNWFSYCGNNPINAADADGRDIIHDLEVWTAGVIAGGVLYDLLKKGAELGANALGNYLDKLADDLMRGGLDKVALGSLTQARGEQESAAGNDPAGTLQQGVGGALSTSGARQFALGLQLKAVARYLEAVDF